MLSRLDLDQKVKFVESLTSTLDLDVLASTVVALAVSTGPDKNLRLTSAYLANEHCDPVTWAKACLRHQVGRSTRLSRRAETLLFDVIKGFSQQEVEDVVAELGQAWTEECEREVEGYERRPPGSELSVDSKRWVRDCRTRQFVTGSHFLADIAKKLTKASRHAPRALLADPSVGYVTAPIVVRSKAIAWDEASNIVLDLLCDDIQAQNSDAELRRRRFAEWSVGIASLLSREDAPPGLGVEIRNGQGPLGVALAHILHVAAESSDDQFLKRSHERDLIDLAIGRYYVTKKIDVDPSFLVAALDDPAADGYLVTALLKRKEFPSKTYFSDLLDRVSSERPRKSSKETKIISKALGFKDGYFATEAPLDQLRVAVEASGMSQAPFAVRAVRARFASVWGVRPTSEAFKNLVAVFSEGDADTMWGTTAQSPEVVAVKTIFGDN